MMTETLADTESAASKTSGETADMGGTEREAARQLVAAARARGEDLTGPDGLLKFLTKTVLETALDEEMNEHLGYQKHAVAGRNGKNSRNGTREKTVLTDNVGQVTIEVPRDRDGTFEPAIVRKRQRRLGDVDTVVLSLYAKGLTTGEISAHFSEVYGASLSKDRISVITDRVVGEMNEWCSRPLLPVYAAIFVDAIDVKVRDGHVGNRPFYAAIGVDLAGRRDVLGIWAGTDGHGESAKYWMSVLAELKNCGVTDVFFLVCDGLKGLPESANAVFPLAKVQTCIIHLIRGTFRYASKKYWDQIARDLKPIYTAPSAAAALAAFEEFEDKWCRTYPAIWSLWRNAWEQFTPFLDYDVEIRKVLCSTNAIESLNARFRRAVTAKGHFPSEQAALKTRYLVVRSLDPKGTGQARWGMRWKPALNAFAVTFADRMPAAEMI